MTHRMLINTTGTPKKHPVTQQVIMPGQSYMEPEDAEPTELVDPADPGVVVQTVADPEALRKVSGNRRRTAGDAKAKDKADASGTESTEDKADANATVTAGDAE